MKARKDAVIPDMSASPTASSVPMTYDATMHSTVAAALNTPSRRAFSAETCTTSLGESSNTAPDALMSTQKYTQDSQLVDKA